MPYDESSISKESKEDSKSEQSKLESS